MNKTKVDDMLIEMISPKIKQIEEKFSNNEPLEQEDINTLLLKSQYNHINHLDQKLNEVTADVASLKHSFALLEQRVEQRFETFEQRFETFEQRFETFENKIESTIQKALNKNMVMMIAALGVFATIFKLIDAFAMR
jgi:DNA repair exonuclease SbcCD ATPase subunit